MSPRKLTGIRRRRRGWRVEIRIHGKLHAKQYPLETPIQELKDWRAEQLEKFGGTVDATGTIAADIPTYMGRVAAMPSYKQREAHLWLWVTELGRARSRHSVTDAEIEYILQAWLDAGLAPATVKKRRTALQSFYAKLNGRKGKNPVKGTAIPPVPDPEARHIDYALIERAIACMPEHLSAKPGAVKTLSLAKVRARVIAHTGIPPGLLKKLQPHDLVLVGAGSVRVSPRAKGAGVEARTLPLTAEALAAFKIFHAARAYGAFATESVNRAFKKGCKKAGLDPKAVHLYDLRHSFLTLLYRVTGDLATVGRMGLHAEGSKVTARYAKGANAVVDVAAAAAVSSALATQRQQALKAAPEPNTRPQSPAKVSRRRKSSRPRRLRVAS